MKKIIITVLATLLSISAVSVYADKPTGDPLGVKILENYINTREAEVKGMTMQLTDDEVKEFKANKYIAKSEHSAAWDVVHQTDLDVIFITSTENSGNNPRSFIYCASMELHGNELKVQRQIQVQHYTDC